MGSAKIKVLLPPNGRPAKPNPTQDEHPSERMEMGSIISMTAWNWVVFFKTLPFKQSQ